MLIIHPSDKSIVKKIKDISKKQNLSNFKEQIKILTKSITKPH
jgi:hypothetical protein